jgi:hypothetical protein
MAAELVDIIRNILDSIVASGVIAAIALILLIIYIRYQRQLMVSQ